MSKENKNEVVKMDVDTEVLAAIDEAVEESKVKIIGKKVGKILLGALVIGGAFFLGTKIGGRSDEVDCDFDDVIVFDDSDMEAEDE